MRNSLCRSCLQVASNLVVYLNQCSSGTITSCRTATLDFSGLTESSRRDVSVELSEEIVTSVKI